MAGEQRTKAAQKHAAPLPAVRLGAAVAPRAVASAKAPLKPRVSMASIAPPAPPAAVEDIAEAPKSVPPPPRSSRDPMNPLAVMQLSSIRIEAAQPIPAPPSRPAVAQVAHMVPPPPPPKSSRPPTYYQQAFDAPAPVTQRPAMLSTPGAFASPMPSAPPSMPPMSTTNPMSSAPALPPPPAPSAPPAAPSAPPSAPPNVRYERAFRAWSHPNLPPYQSNDDLEQPSTGPLTYSVYSASDVPVVRSMTSRASMPGAAVAPMSVGAKVAMLLTGVCVVFGTAAVIILGLADDSPRAKATSTSAAPPPAMIDTASLAPPPAPETTSIITTSFVPPSVTIVDDTPPAAAPKAKKKKILTASSAPPPNPYGK